MKMGMKQQVLSPTMEYGKEADFGSQMLGIGSDGGQGLGHDSKQNAVDDPFHTTHGIEMPEETLRISKGLEGREELKFAGIESLLQISQEQSSEQAGQHPYGQEETGAARNPSTTIG